LLIALIPFASAHKPSFGTYSTSTEAYESEDPSVSIVLYQEVTCEDSTLWLTFEGQEGFELYLQAGVPQIDRLESYKPSLAFVAKGLAAPTIELPFDIPEGYGVEIYSPEPESTDFYEPFTQTESWVWVEDWTIVPEDGTAYVVAWNEAGWTGKMWLAIGTIEEFDEVEISEFIEWNELVNNFHETGEYETPLPVEDIECTEAPTEDPVPPKGGCSSLPFAPSVYALSALLLGIRRRERPLP
jgi:hypothetical protein